MPFRLTHAVAELQQEVKVLQSPLETLGIAEGETEGRHLAQVVSRVEPYIPVRKNWPRKFQDLPPRQLAVVGTVD